MQLTTIAGAALALLVLTGTAAAMPGAPAAQAAETTDGANETAPDRAETGPSERGPDRPGSAADTSERGPPVDLPSQVPDFVGELHQAIGQFLDGDLAGSLGETLSGLTPDENNSDQPAADDETATPDATATPTA